MKIQQEYSHGLLYSIAPDNLSSLHLNDEDGKNEFDWEAYKAVYKKDDSFLKLANFLKTTTVKMAYRIHCHRVVA